MAKYAAQAKLGHLFHKALNFAFDKHEAEYHQVRKDKHETPYITHLLAVSSLVLEAGGNEEAACAALLHDIVEDCDVELGDIKWLFNLNIMSIVSELSEDKTLSKVERKLKYAESIKYISYEAVLVSLADKLHNLRNMDTAPELINPINKQFYKKLIDGFEIRLIGDSEIRLLKEMINLYNQLFSNLD